MQQLARLLTKDSLLCRALVNGADWNKDGSKAAVVMEGKLLICDIANCSIEETWPPMGRCFASNMRNVSWSDDEQFSLGSFSGDGRAPIPIWGCEGSKSSDASRGHTRRRL